MTRYATQSRRAHTSMPGSCSAVLKHSEQPRGQMPETPLVVIHFEKPAESSCVGFGSSLHLPASESLRLLDLGTKV